MKKTNYFLVTVRCGHVGRNKFIPVTFPVFAASGKEAASIGRNMPRAKHHAKDCVISVENVTADQFYEIQKANDSDPYLKCTNRQEQQLYLDDIYPRVTEVLEVKKYRKSGHSLRRSFNDCDIGYADVC